jgi:hypothetical protein
MNIFIEDFLPACIDCGHIYDLTQYTNEDTEDTVVVCDDCAVEDCYYHDLGCHLSEALKMEIEA